MFNVELTMRTYQSIKTHLRPIHEFYQDLRQNHIEGSVNVYPTMFLLIFIGIPIGLLNSNVSNLFGNC
jgi:hypothetical protein